SALRGVTGEDEVARFDGLVAGKAGGVHRLVGGCAVVKLREPPTAGRGGFYRVLDHKLHPVLGGPGHERLGTAKDGGVFRRRVITRGEPGNSGAIGERQRPVPVSRDRDVIAKKGAQIVEVAFFVRHGDQPPVAVSGGDGDAKERGGRSSGLSRGGGHGGDHAG